MSWENKFPCLYQLYEASEKSHPDNYFSKMGNFQSKLAAVSYLEWENRFAKLDADSRHQLFQRAAANVVRRDKANERHWSSLFHILNEAKGSNYLQDLGYSEIKFIPCSSSRTPDV